MKFITYSDFKTNFSKLLAQLEMGEIIAITYGKKKEIAGYFTNMSLPKPKRQLGILKGKAKFTFTPDFKITEKDFLGL